jgi:AraC-like DNA-binding protein
MAENYAVNEGAFGQVIFLHLRSDLVAHAHSESQLAFWLGGGAAHAQIKAQTVHYGEEVALGVNAFEAHDVTLQPGDAPAVFLTFLISRTWLDERRHATGRPFSFLSPRVAINATLRQACWRVLDLMVSALPRAGALDAEVERLLEAAITASAVSAPAHLGAQAGPLNGVMLDHRLRKAVAYMREHVADKTPVEAVAAQVGLSRAHFFALFRDQLNTTPQVFWSAVRVEEAIRRMVVDGQALTEVAMDLGFSAPGSFSRFFKEHVGVSPSTYRRAAAEPMPRTVTGLAPPLPSA